MGTYIYHMCLYLIYHMCAVSFNVYDENRDGTISAGELADTLLALMSEQGVVLAPAQAEEVVRRTVREVSSAPESGSISFEE